jgi:hypothetical protein
VIRRRFFALLASVAILHLTVSAGYSGCASHAADDDLALQGIGRAAEQPMPAHGHEMAAAHRPGAPSALGLRAAPVAQSADSPCESLPPQQCCETLVGCGTFGAIAGARHAFVPAAAYAARIVELLRDAPPSFATAPEPPPPKA